MSESGRVPFRSESKWSAIYLHPGKGLEIGNFVLNKYFRMDFETGNWQ
jgi:hypothetical protein